MKTTLYHQARNVRLHLQRMAIKLSFIILGCSGLANADVSQPCPPLEIKASCAPQGGAALNLETRPDAPAGLTYVVSLPAEGVGATRLAPGDVLKLDLPQPSNRQMTIAVAGLEPEDGGLATCCLSNQRVHLPDACAPTATPTDATAEDLSLQLLLDPECRREEAPPICSGALSVIGAGYDRVRLTLSAELGDSLLAAGANCSTFASGIALCDLPVGSPIVFEMALQSASPGGQTALCGEIGIGADETARTLALQDALARAGYPIGSVDGVLGPATISAVAEFVRDAGLPPMGSEIPAEAFFLLGIDAFADGVPTNNRACAVTQVPNPPLICDSRTTRARGDGCACRYSGMVRVSAQVCACPQGETLGEIGCEAKAAEVVDDSDGPGGDRPDSQVACDPATTVMREGVCECRSDVMTRLSATACEEVVVELCPDGSPQLPGIPCAVPDPVCERRNDAGECCDDLGPEDASCR